MKKRCSPLWYRAIRGVVLLVAVAALSGCGGGGGGSSTPAVVQNADPSGYYSAGNFSALGIKDLQGMFYNGHADLYSNAQGILFDGTYTVSGNSITANLKEFIAPGDLGYTATVTGTFNPTDHSISGTVSTNNAITNAAFNLTYASGRATSTVTTLVSAKTPATWTADIYGNTKDSLTFSLTDNKAGAVAITTTKTFIDAGGNPFSDCSFTGTLTPAGVSSLYGVSLKASGCLTSQLDKLTYTGLAVLYGTTPTLWVEVTYQNTTPASSIAMTGLFQ